MQSLPNFEEFITLCENQNPMDNDKNTDNKTYIFVEKRYTGSGVFGVLLNKKRRAPHHVVPDFQCENCKTTKTPQTRRGPNGNRTLCNRCGIYWARTMQSK